MPVKSFVLDFLGAIFPETAFCMQVTGGWQSHLVMFKAQIRQKVQRRDTLCLCDGINSDTEVSEWG